MRFSMVDLPLFDVMSKIVECRVGLTLVYARPGHTSDTIDLLRRTDRRGESLNLDLNLVEVSHNLGTQRLSYLIAIY